MVDNLLQTYQKYFYNKQFMRPYTSKVRQNKPSTFNAQQISYNDLYYDLNHQKALQSSSEQGKEVRQYASQYINNNKNNQLSEQGQQEKIEFIKLLLRYQLEKMGFSSKQYNSQLQAFVIRYYHIIQNIEFTDIKSWVRKEKSEIVQLILQRNKYHPTNEFQKVKTVPKESSIHAAQSQMLQNNLQILCSICYIETTNYLNRPCQHYFCNECLSSFLKQNIETGQFIVTCPEYECQTPISDSEAKKLLEKPILTKFLKFKRKTEKETNPMNKFCTRPDCEEILVRHPQMQSELYCSLCQISYCPMCFEMSHPDKKCNEIIQSAINQIYTRYQIKKCPHCCAPIQKIDGCNHMTCKKCKSEFCWICLKEIGPYHYRIYNCCGCPGMQFQEPNELCCSRIWMLIFYIFLPILFIGFVAVVIGLLPLFMLFRFFTNPCRWLTEQSNPKFQYKIVSFIFFCDCCLFEALKNIFGYILFMPRSLIFMVFITPIRYFAGVFQGLKEIL